jgi:hypothetical protein
MKVCDVCIKHAKTCSGKEVETPLGKRDLCNKHQEDLENAMKMAASIFFLEKEPSEKEWQGFHNRFRPNK